MRTVKLVNNALAHFTSNQMQIKYGDMGEDSHFAVKSFHQEGNQGQITFLENNEFGIKNLSP